MKKSSQSYIKVTPASSQIFSQLSDLTQKEADPQNPFWKKFFNLLWFFEQKSRSMLKKFKTPKKIVGMPLVEPLIALLYVNNYIFDELDVFLNET
jgi:hypothetical protein